MAKDEGFFPVIIVDDNMTYPKVDVPKMYLHWETEEFKTRKTKYIRKYDSPVKARLTRKKSKMNKSGIIKIKMECGFRIKYSLIGAIESVNGAEQRIKGEVFPAMDYYWGLKNMDFDIIGKFCDEINRQRVFLGRWMQMVPYAKMEFLDVDILKAKVRELLMHYPHLYDEMLLAVMQGVIFPNSRSVIPPGMHNNLSFMRTVLNVKLAEIEKSIESRELKEAMED